jgi:hypothetical protein
MIGTLIAVAYFIVAAFAWWRLSGLFAWGMKFGEVPGGDDIVFALFICFFLAFAWPISLPASVMYEHGINGGKFLYIPKGEKVKMYKRRIEELEREVGIR